MKELTQKPEAKKKTWEDDLRSNILCKKRCTFFVYLKNEILNCCQETEVQKYLELKKNKVKN